VNGQIKRLTFKEFLGDIYYVVRSPSRRFAIIDDRGLQWGSLILLIIPAYFTFEFIGAIYFNHDPFPGYSFLMPAIIAAGFQLVRVYSIHFVARLFSGKSRLPGRARYSQLLAVYGYTTLPTLIVFVPASFFWFALRRPVQWVFAEHAAVMISILIAISIALTIWTLILLVLAMRPVYSMRDLKIVASFFLGFVVQGVILTPATLVWNPVSITLNSLEPVLSKKLIEMIPNSSSLGADRARMTYPIYLDELAYRFKMPRRSDLVVPLPAGEQAKRGFTLTRFLWRARNLSVGRIVGLPGETVELADGKLRINGRLWDEPYIVPAFRSTASVKQCHLKSTEYLILPDNRRLIRDRPEDYLVDRDSILGRCALSKWPMGWWLYRPSSFLRAQPIE
jgi:hypothetical protein